MKNVNVNALISSIIRYMQEDKNVDLVYLLDNSHFAFEQIGYDNWNGGTIIYSLNLTIDILIYRKYKVYISEFQSEILKIAELFIDDSYGEQLSCVSIKPICKQYIDWNVLNGKSDKESVLNLIEKIKNLMISVSTGGPKIQTVDQEYKEYISELNGCLSLLKLSDGNPYQSLWDWYGRWSQNDLNTYKSRRLFISRLYEDLIMQIYDSKQGVSDLFEPTGWERVDRAIYEMKSRMLVAENEEQFQAIGLIGRETIISIAQNVFDKQKHITQDGVDPSETDAKRMLDAFLVYELAGTSNERTRKFAKSAVDMANNLTHKRTAISREAEMCITSVSAIASLIKIIEDSKLENMEGVKNE